MVKPKVLIMSGYGINCEEETAYAFDVAGGKSEIVHVNDLIENPKRLKDYQIMAFPGGFAYGDDTGAGNAYANRANNNIGEEIREFVKADKLVLGTCNGFQIIVNMGLVPAFDKDYGKRDVALVANDNARYTARWVDIDVKNDTPWLKGIDTLSCPIAHGEGKFYAEPKVLEKLKKNKQIAAMYVRGDMCEYLGLDGNPNGSLLDIAGITDPSGRVFGMMPHAERAIFFTQRPDWPLLAQKAKAKEKSLPLYNGPLRIFKNGVKYFA